jgi:hypothetical protein
MSFIMQQWLTAAIYWLAYAKLGIAVFGNCISRLCLHHKRCVSARQVSFQGKFQASFLAAFLTALLLTPFLVSRPKLFTLLILICELYLLERYIASRRLVYLIALPILSALLVNMHAAMWPYSSCCCFRMS